MPMEDVLNLMFENLGFDLPEIMLFIIACSSIIFMAKDLRLGIMFLFFLSSMGFLVWWASNAAVATLTIYAITILASFVIMTLSLLLTKSHQGQGGII